MTRTRTLVVSVALVVPTLLATGCGSSSKKDSSAATTVAVTTTAAPATTATGGGKAEVCAARSALTTSLADVKNVDITKGIDGVKGKLETVRTNAQAMADAARTDYKPQADALQSAADQLKTALDAVGNGKPAANLAQVGTALAALGSAAGALFAKIDAGCPAG